jgi:hypothetical protein|tara:strand:- start:42 stop:197 length:156 start_codon:yes stop_codon:yes gene_type:complete
METVKVKIKNKPNELKAVGFLGKYSQNKGLLNEVIKTLDWLEDVDKKKEAA